MKVASIRFAIPGGKILTPGAPPSGSAESHLWQVTGNVVRAPAGFPLSALSASGVVRVIVELQKDAGPAPRIWIRAVPQGTHILGAVPETPVEPGRWSGPRCEVTIEVDAAKLVAGGVDEHHAVWRWKWRRDGEARLRELGLTEHLLFVTVSPPLDPWTGSGTVEGPLTPPWLAALTQACRWGRGATTHREAASRIVQSLFALGGASSRPCLEYRGDLTEYLNPDMGNPRWFNCEQFIADLGTTDCVGFNCFEAATTVVTFANLLGCKLVPGVIEGDCLDLYHLNRVRSLGLPAADAASAFLVHAVALEKVGSSSLADDLVYDASLMVDGDSKPTVGPGHFVLADGMPLGRTTSPAGAGTFFPQLVAAQSIDGCRARTIERPRVGAEPPRDDVDSCPLKRHERYLQELKRVVGPLTTVLPAPWMPAISGYRGRAIYVDRPGVPRIGLPPLPRASRALFTPVVPGRNHAIRVDWWVHNDPAVALSFMAELLAMIEIRVERAAAGATTVYTVPRRTSVLVFRGGMVARYASVGRTPLDMVHVYNSAVVTLR
jgi:hypothetical protein